MEWSWPAGLGIFKTAAPTPLTFTEGVQYKKVTKWKSTSSVRNYWTQGGYMYNMQGHGLAVENTGTLCDRNGGK